MTDGLSPAGRPTTTDRDTGARAEPHRGRAVGRPVDGRPGRRRHQGRGADGRRPVAVDAEPGSTFYALNRNKRSLAVDLKSDGGREIFTGWSRRRHPARQLLAGRPGPARLRLRVGLAASTRASSTARSRGSCPVPTATARLLDELAQMMGSMAYMTGPVGRPLRAGVVGGRHRRGHLRGAGHAGRAGRSPADRARASTCRRAVRDTVVL